MNNKNSIYGIIGIFLLALTTFIVPKDVMDYTYFYFFLVLSFYVVIWIFILKYMKSNNLSDYEHQIYDYLIYELIYLLALPGIFYLLMYNIGESVWHIPFLEKSYLIIISTMTFFRVVLFKTKHAPMASFSVLSLCPLLNVIIINQIFFVWYIANFMSNGYR